MRQTTAIQYRKKKYIVLFANANRLIAYFSQKLRDKHRLKTIQLAKGDGVDRGMRRRSRCNHYSSRNESKLVASSLYRTLKSLE